MPKFRTFDGMRDPSNHLKAYDSKLSFWASEDDDTVDLFMDKFGASIIAEEDEEALMNGTTTIVPKVWTTERKANIRANGKCTPIFPIDGEIHKIGRGEEGGRWSNRNSAQRRTTKIPEEETEIEKLIRIGHLKEFVRREHDRSPSPLGDSPRKSTKPRSRIPTRITGRIDTMSGGLAVEEITPIPGSRIADLDFTVREALRTMTIRASFTVMDISGPSRGIGRSERPRVCYQLSVPRGNSLKEPPKKKRHKRNSPGVMKTARPLEDQENSPQEKKSVKKGLLTNNSRLSPLVNNNPRIPSR
ncbi:hypothetical protein LIER_01880 [Lithospermum erythrorhizon]|uniref:Uncharacterized protein n=1 Tax=Lithospermum erythrorhizon TaxID=34254 RepID=A0AAV3NML9_LITER